MVQRRARYVAVEGIDGAGKSTFTRALATRLRRDGLRVRVRREPNDPVLGRYAQRVGPTDPWTSAVFFTLDRYLARPKLERDLASADVVLTDRSFWSTLAYQGSAVPAGARRRLAKIQAASAIRPDRVILLDLPSEEGIRRVGGRGRSRAPFERRATLRRVAREYRRLAERNHWLVLDAQTPTARLVEQATDRLRLPIPRTPRR